MNLLGQQRTACRSGGIWSLLSIDHLAESRDVVDQRRR
jgi:hypothetical protein